MAGKEPCPSSSCHLEGQLNQALLAQELLLFIAKSFLTLCNPMDCSSLGFSVHGMSQARLLDLVAISSPREYSQTQGLNLCLLHWQLDSLLLRYLGSPTQE